MLRSQNKGWRSLVAAPAFVLGIVAGPATAQTAPPPLVIVISVDALSSDLLNRWQPRFTGGMARLAREGVIYANAYVSHGVTETCAGHATLVTGVHPRRHGIPANSWYDTEAGSVTACQSAPVSAARTNAHGPWRLTASTLGDWMKAANPESQVYSISGKHYAAAMMGGQRADGMYFYDSHGAFSAGGVEPARQVDVDTLNRAAGRPLTQAREPSGACRPYVRPAEETIGGGMPDFTDLDAITLEGAWSLVETHGLGRDAAPDLLAVSLSATDMVGHVFGGSSWRMCEQMLAMDAMLGRFLGRLDASGIDAVVALAADHGQSDTPAILTAQGYPAAYAPMTAADLDAELRRRFDLAHPVIVTGTGAPSRQGDAVQLYLVGADGGALTEPLRTRAIAAAQDWLKTRPEVHAVFTAAELVGPTENEVADELSLRDRMALSHVAGRSGDLTVVYQPYLTLLAAKAGEIFASHGSPYDYDRRIPLIFWSRGVIPDFRSLPVELVDLAPTLAARLAISPEEAVDGRALPIW